MASKAYLTIAARMSILLFHLAISQVGCADFRIDEFELKYELQLVRGGLAPSNFLIRNQRGKAFDCFLPVTTPSGDNIHDRSSHRDSATFEHGACLMLTQGWWTYKVCSQTNVTQFHLNAKGEQKQLTSLGTYSTLQSQVHHTKYVNGSYCELGQRNRSSTVEFICDQTAKQPRIAEVSEPMTCVYHFKVATMSICSRPKPPVSISCSAAQSSSPSSSSTLPVSTSSLISSPSSLLASPLHLQPGQMFDGTYDCHGTQEMSWLVQHGSCTHVNVYTSAGYCDIQTEIMQLLMWFRHTGHDGVYTVKGTIANGFKGTLFYQRWLMHPPDFSPVNFRLRSRLGSSKIIGTVPECDGLFRVSHVTNIEKQQKILDMFAVAQAQSLAEPSSKRNGKHIKSKQLDGLVYRIGDLEVKVITAGGSDTPTSKDEPSEDPDSDDATDELQEWAEQLMKTIEQRQRDSDDDSSVDTNTDSEQTTVDNDDDADDVFARADSSDVEDTSSGHQRSDIATTGQSQHDDDGDLSAHDAHSPREDSDDADIHADNDNTDVTSLKPDRHNGNQDATVRETLVDVDGTSPDRSQEARSNSGNVAGAKSKDTKQKPLQAMEAKLAKVLGHLFDLSNLDEMVSDARAEQLEDERRRIQQEEWRQAYQGDDEH
eukprot:TRINITY_DN4379_c0_g1_i1.p1 TRINITY_DN4379_c0_g1~~TRINITY_DN4379_c0_g1_i1.p1  ORF type:complete len:654 (+),score=129.01 TRINITY_DN4379_c0_g1_i1:1-1962(+)